MVIQKTPDEIVLMARAAAVLAEVHEVLADAVAPGVTTAELDALAAAEIAGLRPGLVFAIEPMFTLGGPGFRIADDGWTISTLDGARAAHWEHTVAITEAGPWVLTARPDEQALPSGTLAALG